MTDNSDNVIDLFKKIGDVGKPSSDDDMIFDIIENTGRLLLLEIYAANQFDTNNKAFLKDFAVVMLMIKAMLLRSSGKPHNFQQLIDEQIHIDQFDD